MSVATPLLLLQITRADVRDMLRADALGCVLGVLLLAVGLSSAAFYGSSRRREASLLWLGSFELLYGLRLLARSTLSASSASKRRWPSGTTPRRS
jgi:hypothetical protein